MFVTYKRSGRVVIINNIKSDTVDQAIFILKSNEADDFSGYAEETVACEAQRIIDRYVSRIERAKRHCLTTSGKERKRAAVLKTAAFLSVSLLCIGLGLVLLYYAY